MHSNALHEHIYAFPSLQDIALKSANILDKDAFFTYLCQRRGLEGLEIDLKPGTALLPMLSGQYALPPLFTSLRRLSITCYPEIALALPMNLKQVEQFQLDITRIPNRYAQPSDTAILKEIFAQLAHCPKLRLLKIGIEMLASDFPSSTTFPLLSGISLINLAKACPKLEDIDFLTNEWTGIDGTAISTQDFEHFCEALPGLRALNIKFDPETTEALQTSALQSLGKHCPELEVLRLKTALHLPSLPAAPRVLPGSGEPTAQDEPSTSTKTPAAPLFPHLTHLALARLNTPLTPETETSLVHAWADALQAHFPRLEILEAWGDAENVNVEALKYFLPLQEPLATTWEFLSGVEQDLWGEETEEEEVESLEEWEEWGMARDETGKPEVGGAEGDFEEREYTQAEP